MNKDRIKVLVVDDHAIVRMGLVALLEAEGDITVVGDAEDGAAAIRLATQLKPDVVILDLMMPVMDGVTATRELRVKAPDARVLVLTTSTVSDDLAHAMEAGACGIVPKSAANASLLAAIRAVAAGEQAVAPEIRELISLDPPVPELTARQREILDSVTRGLRNADIARELGIAEDSVKEHLSAVFHKIGASNRAEAIAIALRKHLLKT